MTERFTVDSDGKYWDKIENKYVTIDHLFSLVESLDKENEQLKEENQALKDFVTINFSDMMAEKMKKELRE